MKEAAGEANMTVITIVLIGIVAAAGAILLPNIFKGMEKKSCCTQNNGVWYKNACYNRANCQFDDRNQVKLCTGSSFTPSCD